MPVFKRFANSPSISVQQVMSAPAVTLSINSGLHQVSEIMWTKKIGSMIIVDEQGKIVGVVTERDILYCAAKKLFDRQDVKASSVMSKNVITVGPADSLHSAIEKMRLHNLRHIPVMDSTGRPLGVLSL